MSDGDRGYGYEPDEEDDDYYTYDATDDDDDGRRRPIVILAIVALIVVFAGVVFFAYKQGLKEGAQGNPPVIRADDAPVKVAPANPGGMKFPHQDKTVYERIAGGADETPPGTGAEHLLPSPEEPMAVTPKPAEPAPAAGSAETAPVEQQAVPPVSAAPTASAEPQAPAASTPVEQQPPAAQSAPATAATGGYVVQLAAFRDEPAARAEFRKLQKKYAALAALAPDIQRADLGSKGIYYRLRAGYLDKARAADLCASLKAQGQACLVKPR